MILKRGSVPRRYSKPEPPSFQRRSSKASRRASGVMLIASVTCPAFSPPSAVNPLTAPRRAAILASHAGLLPDERQAGWNKKVDADVIVARLAVSAEARCVGMRGSRADL